MELYTDYIRNINCYTNIINQQIIEILKSLSNKTALIINKIGVIKVHNLS